VKTLVSVLVFSVVAPATAAAQIPVGTRVGSDTVPATASTYDDGGRRDPFLTLIQPKRPNAATPATGKPAAGLVALGVADVTVTGIVKVGSGFIATLRSPDGKSFTAKMRDRLQDGEVKSIDAEGVVFVQQMADALGVVRPREVRKTLRQTGAEQ
jgi:Tfp pilus assembly protein PilP